MVPSSHLSQSSSAPNPQDMNVVFQTFIGILRNKPEQFGIKLQTVLRAIVERSLTIPSKELAFPPGQIDHFAMLFGLSLNIKTMMQQLKLTPQKLSGQCLQHLERVNGIFQLQLRMQHEPGCPLNKMSASSEPQGVSPHLSPAHMAKSISLGMTYLKTAIETGLYDKAPEDGNYKKKEFEYIARSNALAEANIPIFNHCSPPLTQKNPCHDAQGCEHSQPTKINQGALINALPELVREEEARGQIEWTAQKIQAYAQARLALTQQSGSSSAAAAASP